MAKPRKPRLTRLEREALTSAIGFALSGEDPWEHDPRLFPALKRAEAKPITLADDVLAEALKIIADLESAVRAVYCSADAKGDPIARAAGNAMDRAQRFLEANR